MKKLNRVFIVVLLCLCLIPSLGVFLTGPSSAGANEILAGAPSVMTKDGRFNTDVLSDAADWFNDHFAFRQELITLWSKISVGVFQTSSVEKVTAGTDGWLYYSLTLDDYTGNRCSDRELYAITKNLSLMQEYTEAQGLQFLFTVAPNKNSLYPENMPARYEDRHEASNYSLLLPMMQDAGIHTVDLSKALLSQNEVLYYRTDSHWNSKGAACGADTILSALGKSTDYFAGPFTQNLQHSGDLYQMLYPAGTETEPDYEYAPGFSFTTAKNANGGEAVTIQATNEQAEGSVYFWRDSFGNALYSYIAQSFGSAVFTRSADYDLMKAVNTGADDLVIELVERNLKNLVTSELVFPAPARTAPVAGTVCENAVYTVENGTGDREGLIHVTGTLNHDTEVKSNIYILAEGVYYESCIAFDEDGNEGFSAWIPASDVTEIVIM